MTTPARDELVQETERTAERPGRRPPCSVIPDEDCRSRPRCEACPARLPLLFGRWP